MWLFKEEIVVSCGLFFVLLAFGFVFYTENFPIDVATIKLSICRYPKMFLFLTWKRAMVLLVMHEEFFGLTSSFAARCCSACVVQL